MGVRGIQGFFLFLAIVKIFPDKEGVAGTKEHLCLAPSLPEFKIYS